jgi:hypothetical protein
MEEGTVRYPRGCSQVERVVADHFPHLRPAQRRGLALWVDGAVLAQSACQSAVVAALLALGTWHGLRQYLREWTDDGEDKAAPCGTQLDVAACFAPLLRWVLAWWRGDQLALAVDATAHGDRVVALVVSVLYRGAALPVAWHILPANQPGAWRPHCLRLLRLLRPAVPASMTVLVLADRGLWSPRLWKRVRDLGWHPLLRLQATTTFAPAGRPRPLPGPAAGGRPRPRLGRARRRLPRPADPPGRDAGGGLGGGAGRAVGAADRPGARRGRRGLVRPADVGGAGFPGAEGRRLALAAHPADRRAARGVALAGAGDGDAVGQATGTRAEDAERAGRPPGRLTGPPTPVAPAARRVSIFRRGLAWLRQHLAAGRPWRRLWLAPEPWPDALPGLHVTLHVAT